MDGWVTIRYDGKDSMVVGHTRRLPGERWEVSAQRLTALGEKYPGLFSWAGDGLGDTAPETGAVRDVEDVVIARGTGGAGVMVEIHPLDGLGIEAAGLSDRIEDALASAGVTWLATLEGMDDEALLDIAGIGKGSVRAIRERVAFVRAAQETSELLAEVEDDGFAE